jgi:hypothetical protein
LSIQCINGVTFRRTEKFGAQIIFGGCIDDDYIGQSVVLSPQNCGIIVYQVREEVLILEFTLLNDSPQK